MTDEGKKLDEDEKAEKTFPFKGVWIPKSIWLADLSPNEKCFLAEISALDDGRGCFASDYRLAELLRVSKQTVSNLLSIFRKKGKIINLKLTREDILANRKRRLRVMLSGEPFIQPRKNSAWKKTHRPKGQK